MENKHKQFKPFDRVLVRRLSISNNLIFWKADIFSHMEGDTFYVTIGSGYVTKDEILPYEGNESLVGTTDEPEEEIKLEYWEWIMATNTFSDDPSAWYLEQCANIEGEDKLDTRNKNCYLYFIRFKDFNPNDMEETRKHTLCVKNGKIIRYKG